MDNLEKLDVDIDYLVINHAEQDHSGSIPNILEKYKNAVLITNSKCKGLLMEFLPIAEEKYKVVDDGDTLDLGSKNLNFLLHRGCTGQIPW